MIRRLINLLAVVVLVAFAVGLYKAKTDARDDRRRAVELAAELADETEAVRIMRNEVGYLESPERLRALAEDHLGLEPIDPLRVVTLDDAPLLIEPAPPTDAPGPGVEAGYAEEGP